MVGVTAVTPGISPVRQAELADGGGLQILPLSVTSCI